MFLLIVLLACQKKEISDDSAKPAIPKLEVEKRVDESSAENQDKEKASDTKSVPKEEEMSDSYIRESIVQAIHSQDSKIYQCYNNVAEREFNPPQGIVVLDLQISHRGDLTQLTVVEDRIKKPELVECLSRTLKSLKFIESGKILKMKYKFLFVLPRESVPV